MGEDTGTERSETQTAIMEATYRALCEHGYADLTMQAIADEFEKSKSLIHYHYDTKEELLVAFLDYLIDGFLAKVEDTDDEDPRERLDTLVDTLLAGPEKSEDFQVAMLELRSQAPYVEAYREAFSANDAHLRSLLADTVRDGIEAGEFRDVDPDRVAETLLVLVDGARSRSVLFGDSDTVEHTRQTIDGYVRSHLLPDDT
ncbi:transcriptional regulator, TetR family [Halarchaeum acidiphilum MH1-52-1]|uniref:Transcriptional regulator, TetR family n=1 Tax=Halarchaeum acidiphilum MH1-52-1 TaxID=1261545 RepID=U2YSV9_9EURY|nr:TetR/AcrR family transcriptional regulator [Halarchaeum acidiphilum]GAD52100.1 transcriptional regulator, TetR family [Halarchaeum acidiphilum MH1-52-1]